MNTTRQAKTGARGFTLVELLAVIAVVGLLMALLLPALSGARKRAMQSTCLSNMRQIGASFTLYMADHEGAFMVNNFAEFRGDVVAGLVPYLPFSMVRAPDGTDWVSSENTCPLYRSRNLSYGRSDPGYGAYAFHHALRGNSATPGLPYANYSTLGGRRMSDLMGNRSAGSYTISHWKPNEYGVIWDNGWLSNPKSTVPHNYYGIPGHDPVYHVMFADLHAAPHAWVHRNGVIPNGTTLNVPPEYRDDQYRIVE